LIRHNDERESNEVKSTSKRKSPDRRVRVTALEHLALEAADRIAAPSYFEPQCAPSRERGIERVRMEVWRAFFLLTVKVGTRSVLRTLHMPVDVSSEKLNRELGFRESHLEGLT
jgi:hypothetical protein